MSFPEKTPEEIKVVTFDFEPEAATGSTLTLPVLTVTVKRQNAAGDAVPGDITATGITVPMATQTVQVLIGGGLHGATYRLSCAVAASNGEFHEIAKDLPIKNTAALVE